MVEAAQMVERHHPDIIILDLQMPVMDGWSASIQIKTVEPNAQIAYSSLEDLNFKDTSQTNSLDAFAKDTTTPELIALVRG